METDIVLYKTLTVPEIEGALSSLSTELEEDYAPLQGKQDAAKKDEITELGVKIKMVDYTHAKVQGVIFFIVHRLLVASNIQNVKEFEQAALAECEQIQFDIDHKEHSLPEMEKRKSLCMPDPFKTKYGKWLLPAAIIAGVIEFILSYGNYRHEYPVLFSLVAATAIATVISTSHVFYVPFVMKPANPSHQKLRGAAVLLAAFIFFYIVAGIRIDSLNNEVNISVSGGQHTGHVSRWPVFIISAILFIGVFAGALALWKTKEERLKEAEYKKVTAEIAETKAEIAAQAQKILDLKNKVLTQKGNARDAYDYCKKSIRRAKHIGDNAIKIYKQTFAKFRSTVPAFFDKPVELTYNEDLHFSPTENQTA